MGFKRSYEDSVGNIYPESYWYPANITINKGNDSGSLAFYGYKDKASKDAGKTCVTVRNYSITGEAFSSYLAALLLGEENALALAYRIAFETKDVADELGNMVSFFETAEQV